MTGSKGKSGGRRAGAGRPATAEPVETLALSPQARQELRILYGHLRAVRNDPKFSQRMLVEEFIHEKWVEFDEMIQVRAEELAPYDVVSGDGIL